MPIIIGKLMHKDKTIILNFSYPQITTVNNLLAHKPIFSYANIEMIFNLG